MKLVIYDSKQNFNFQMRTVHGSRVYKSSKVWFIAFLSLEIYDLQGLFLARDAYRIYCYRLCMELDTISCWPKCH